MDFHGLRWAILAEKKVGILFCLEDNKEFGCIMCEISTRHSIANVSAVDYSRSYFQGKVMGGDMN